MPRIGPFTACLYALLIAWAYGSQIIKLYQIKDPTGISLQFILVALVAVLLRMATIGSAIWEIWQKAKIRSVSNLALAGAEAVVLIGLAWIGIQILIYT